MTPPRNLPASVRQRLLNRARSDRRPFNELLQYFAMERFLYRLSRSDHVEQFILKGALMLYVWQPTTIRPTMDIDLLGRTHDVEADLVAQLRDILAVDVEPDGLTFDAESIRAERIAEGADYEGIRIRFSCMLVTAQVHMRVDVGFGDVVYPEPETSDLPTLLDFPAPRLLCYSREATIAEKLETAIKFGVLNSRMKDFYDIWLLSRQFDFNGPDLAEAIRLTFVRRGTVLPPEIEVFTQHFIDSKQIQWTAFRNRLQPDHVPASFAQVAASIAEFLSPITAAVSTGHPSPIRWNAPGPWT